MDEVGAVDIYLGTVLRDYAGLRALIMPAGETKPRLYAREAPANQQFPYVIFNYNSGLPTQVMGVGLGRAAMQINMAILVVTEGPSLQTASAILEQINKAINATPEKQDIVLGDDTYYVKIMYLVNPLSYNDSDAGKRLNYYGGLYRFWVQKLP